MSRQGELCQLFHLQSAEYNDKKYLFESVHPE